MSNDLVIKGLEEKIECLENLLQKQQKQCNTIINHLWSGFASFKIKYNNNNEPESFIFEEVNSAFENIMNVNRAALLGKKLADVMPSGEQYWRRVFIDVFNTKTDKYFKGFNSTGDKYVEVKVVRDSEERLLCFLSDLTDQLKFEEELKERNEEIQSQNEEYRALNEELEESYEKTHATNKSLILKEKELKEANDLLQLVLNHIPVRVFWKDLESNYLGCNKVFAQDAGQGVPDKVVGKTDIQLFAREIAELYRADDRFVMNSGNPKLNYEEPQGQEGEELRYLRTNKIPLLNEKHETIGVLGTYEDITELKKIQTELIEAKEKAEESDRLKSAFLANMSHEIRTPMNGIVGFTQLLNDKGLSEDEVELYINIINESSQQLLRIVNDIVDISKIESGLIDVKTGDVNLKEFSSEIFKFYKTIAEQQKLTFKVNYTLPPERNVLRTDLTKLRQIVDNLISNALKFTNKGEVVVNYAEVSGQCQITVADTGIGISTKYQENIFDRFTQGEIKYIHNNKHQGTGLGLSISKGYVEKLGGKLWLESEEGKGTTFFISLPF